jgi:hypothetical protein
VLASGEHTFAEMQVVAEIQLDAPSVLEYLLSPVTKLGHEAGR